VHIKISHICESITDSSTIMYNKADGIVVVGINEKQMHSEFRDKEEKSTPQANDSTKSLLI